MVALRHCLGCCCDGGGPVIKGLAEKMIQTHPSEVLEQLEKVRIEEMKLKLEAEILEKVIALRGISG